MTTYFADEATAPGEIILEVEDLEEGIAPGIPLQHNESLVRDEVELNVEELEEVIAPIWPQQHNE